MCTIINKSRKVKSRFRFLLYIFLGITFFFLINFVLWLDQILNIKNLYVSFSISFTIIDGIVSHFLWKSRFIYDLLLGILISCLSIYLALSIGHSEPFPGVDPYGIYTAIYSYILLSIVFLEITYRVKSNYNLR